VNDAAVRCIATAGIADRKSVRGQSENKMINYKLLKIIN